MVAEASPTSLAKPSTVSCVFFCKICRIRSRVPSTILAAPPTYDFSLSIVAQKEVCQLKLQDVNLFMHFSMRNLTLGFSETIMGHHSDTD